MTVPEKMTWREAVAQWNKGENVWSAELGGIGPGYEQAIQTLLFEILARWKGKVPKVQAGSKSYPEVYEKHVDKVVSALDKSCGGFSGAQVGAAKATAFQFMVFGYGHMMGKLERERHILVSKVWPRTESPTAEKERI